MKREPHDTDDSWESDAVWGLLDQSPPATASSRFATDTVRAAKLMAAEKPWWSRLIAPVVGTGLAGATAALIFALIGPSSESFNSVAALDSPQAVAIQDIAETETLIAAADQLEDFSDNELVSLIGF
ncbi:MAG: hypothetical protein V4640_00360 [Verrucomicrobiota bacterium]